MLKRLLQATAVAGVLAAVPVQQAQAACSLQNYGGFSFCFDFNLTTGGLTLTYGTALGSSTGVITAVGVGGFDTFTGGSILLPPTGWAVDANLSSCGGLGSVATFQFCASTTNGINGAIDQGGTLQLSFTGATGTGEFAWIHLQDVNGTACSLKISSTGAVVGAGVGDCTPTTTTPEPASLFLVGTGLLGIGGFVRRRRRNA